MLRLQRLLKMRENMEYLLKLPSVRCKNPGAVLEKINKMSTAGVDKMQVISDFDYTLSRFELSGEQCQTTHAVFDHEAQRIDPELGRKLNSLRDKYMPIEFDHELSLEEKTPHMLAWWSTAHNEIVRSGFSKDVLRSFVMHSKVHLRDGSKELLEWLESESVPLTLFSAGLGDLITMILERDLGRVPLNLHLIANMMEFNEEEKVVGFLEPLIHTFNKNSSVIRQEKAFFQRLSGKDQVLLLGDSLGDLHMDVGVENEGNILKIGFLNFSVDRLLPRYLDGYDLVLVQDSTMDVPLSLLRSLSH